MSPFTFPPPPPPPPSAPVASTNNSYSPYGVGKHQDSGHQQRRGRLRGHVTNSRGYGRVQGDHQRNFNSNQHNMTTTDHALGSSQMTFHAEQLKHENAKISGQLAPSTQAQAQTNAYNWLYQSMHMYSQAAAFASQYQGQDARQTALQAQGEASSFSGRSSTFQQPQQQYFNSARGVKRKRGDVNFSQRGGHRHWQSSAQRSSGGRMQVAPAVPNFGFSMPESVRRDDDFRKVKDSQPLEKKQKHNLLGLTPRSVEHEESGEEEEVVDEEASGMNTGIGLQFEYNGQVAVLSSEKEIAAWIAERKKRYPTKARIAQKNAEALKRRQEIEEARERALNSKRSQEPAQEKRKKIIKRDADENERANAHLERAEKLRKKLKAAEAKAAEALARHKKDSVKTQKYLNTEPSPDEENFDIRNQQPVTKTHLGLDYSSTSSSSSSTSSSSRESSPSASSEISDSSSSLSVSTSSTSSLPTASESGSGLPCPASLGNRDVNVDADCEDTTMPVPKKHQTNDTEHLFIPTSSNVTEKTVSSTSKMRPCKFFQRSGQCRNGQKCRFSHEVTPRTNRQNPEHQGRAQKNRKSRQSKRGEENGGSNSGYITLSERLQMQEQHERERRLLQVIKDLGRRGVLNPE